MWCQSTLTQLNFSNPLFSAIHDWQHWWDIFHGFCRYVMNLRMLWKREGTLWTIMAVIFFPSDGLIMWLYFKLITPFCMIVWPKGIGARVPLSNVDFVTWLYVSAFQSINLISSSPWQRVQRIEAFQQCRIWNLSSFTWGG